jgi:hypothetical protein
LYKFFGDVYRGRQKARESWEHFIADKIVYGGQVGNGDQIIANGYYDSYLRDKLWLEIGFLIKDEAGNTNANQILVEHKVVSELNAIADDSEILNHWNRNSMFITSRYTVQNAQEFQFRPIRSSIWLKRFNNIDDAVLKVTWDKLQSSFDATGVRFGENREHYGCFFVLGEIPPRNVGQFPNNIIERTPNTNSLGSRRIIDGEPLDSGFNPVPPGKGAHPLWV